MSALRRLLVWPLVLAALLALRLGAIRRQGRLQ
jgi:hypothetical protein